MAGARGMNLRFIAPVLKEDKPIVQLQKEELAKGSVKWLNSLILYVPGNTPPTLDFMNNFVERKWNMVAKPTLLLDDEYGYFIAKFNSLHECRTVLYSGPFYVGTIAIIMKQWTPDFSFQKEEFFRVIPLWVQLPNLPLNCWGMDSLSRICSAIGKPIYADECTWLQSKIAYARVLIDTDVAKPLPEAVMVEDPSGKTFVQKVVFEWKPLNLSTLVGVGNDSTNMSHFLDQQTKIDVKRKAVVALGSGVDVKAADKSPIPGSHARIDGSNTKDGHAQPGVSKKVKLYHDKLLSEDLQKFAAIEAEMTLQDRIMEETTDSKKTLEAYVCDNRRELNDKYYKLTSSSEKEMCIGSLQHVSEWLNKDGKDETKMVYIAKLKELKEARLYLQEGDQTEERYQKYTELEFRILGLNISLSYYKNAAMSKDQSFDNICLQEKHKVVLTACAETESWLKHKMQQQDALPKYATPVFTIADLKEKTDQLARRLSHSLMASTRGMGLSFIAPAVREGKPVVQLREVVDEEFNEWQNALILYVPGETSWTMSSMLNFVEQEWNMVAKPTLVFHEEDGYFSVKFDSLDDRNKILCSGPYYIGGKPVIMKPWTSDLRFEKEVFLSTIPLWVQFPNLPLNFWGVESLSRIGSVIGEPLYADECTVKKSRISYARVLIDTDVTKPLPDSVTISDLSTGKTFVQKVVFEWIPALADHVKVHIDRMCSL
ncbi:hypothetical protein KSS87_007638 [Heliosperma pusillum]|nr:hypothetical protein KSS87_007638 [Heliosperma pusillum]